MHPSGAEFISIGSHGFPILSGFGRVLTFVYWSGAWCALLRHAMIGGWVSFLAGLSCVSFGCFRFCFRGLFRFRFCFRVLGPFWVCLPALFPFRPGPWGVLLPKRLMAMAVVDLGNPCRGRWAYGVYAALGRWHPVSPGVVFFRPGGFGAFCSS